MQARPVAGDEPGDPVRYAVQLHVLMSQAEMEVWESLADRCRLAVDDVVHAAALFGLKYHVDLKTAAREPTDVDTMYMPADPDENPRCPKE